VLTSKSKRNGQALSAHFSLHASASAAAAAVADGSRTHGDEVVDLGTFWTRSAAAAAATALPGNASLVGIGCSMLHELKVPRDSVVVRTPRISHFTPRTSHLTPHTSHLTPHTSHLTPHTSHLTPHTTHRSVFTSVEGTAAPSVRPPPPPPPGSAVPRNGAAAVAAVAAAVVAAVAASGGCAACDFQNHSLV
jgi:hypothetical protein